MVKTEPSSRILSPSLKIHQDPSKSSIINKHRLPAVSLEKGGDAPDPEVSNLKAMYKEQQAEIDRLTKMVATAQQPRDITRSVKTTLIPRPNKLGNLVHDMQLTDQKVLYNECRAVVASAMKSAGVDFNTDFRKHIPLFADVAKKAKRDCKQLGKYESDWATFEIIKSALRNRRNYNSKITRDYAPPSKRTFTEDISGRSGDDNGRDTEGDSVICIDDDDIPVTDQRDGDGGYPDNIDMSNSDGDNGTNTSDIVGGEGLDQYITHRVRYSKRKIILSDEDESDDEVQAQARPKPKTRIRKRSRGEVDSENGDEEPFWSKVKRVRVVFELDAEDF